MAVLNKFFGRTVSEAAGYGIGGVLVAPMQPIIQGFTNDTWFGATALGVTIPPDVYQLALGVAQGQVSRVWARDMAQRAGYSPEVFGHLIDVANVGPGMAQAFNLWRRGELDQPGFRRALLRLGLEQEWIDALWNVRQEILDPAQLAVMIQRTVIPNAGLLPNQPSTAGSNVPPMPVVDIDPILEAAGSGIDRERLAAMARIIGLPASPDLAARMHFRKIITEGAFNQAILEGNTRGEWAPFLLEGFRDIPTSHDFIEGRLRGWIDDAAMYDGAARHGMRQEDVDLLFKVTGRPLSFHQVFIGERRGGTYDGPTGGIEPAFLKSLRESNIRPEWYNLAWAQRHTLPNVFAIRLLTQAGDLTEAEAKALLMETGWREELATKVAAVWAGASGGTTANPYLTKAQTQLWGTTHSSYIAAESNQDDARARFAALGVPATVQDEVLALWDSERDLIRKQLTPAQIKKAFEKLSRNYATGAPWTRDDAIAALQARGYSVTEANDYLDIPSGR